MITPALLTSSSSLDLSLTLPASLLTSSLNSKPPSSPPASPSTFHVFLPREYASGSFTGTALGPLAGVVPQPSPASRSITVAKTAALSEPGRLSMPFFGSVFTTSGCSPFLVAYAVNVRAIADFPTPAPPAIKTLGPSLPSLPAVSLSSWSFA